MNFISLGGVGGCTLAFGLRNFNQPSYPYDWLVTSQSFIINTFLKMENFFEFDEKYVYDETFLFDKSRKGVILHDFKKWDKKTSEKLYIKYKRRFDRLEEIMMSDEDIVLVRSMEDMEDNTGQRRYLNVYDREPDDIDKWVDFLRKQNEKFSKNIKLLLLAHNKKLIKKVNDENIKIEFISKGRGVKQKKLMEHGYRFYTKIKDIYYREVE